MFIFLPCPSVGVLMMMVVVVMMMVVMMIMMAMVMMVRVVNGIYQQVVYGVRDGDKVK